MFRDLITSIVVIQILAHFLAFLLADERQGTSSDICWALLHGSYHSLNLPLPVQLVKQQPRT